MTNTITIDLDTGHWVVVRGDQESQTITGVEGIKLASYLLPGWPADEIDAAYGAWLEADTAPTEPELFAVGSRVSHVELPDKLKGKVVRRVLSNDGELHTVWVRWDTGAADPIDTETSANPYSPRELVAL